MSISLIFFLHKAKSKSHPLKIKKLKRKQRVLKKRMLYLVILTSILIGGAFYLEEEYAKSFNADDADHLLESHLLIRETEILLELATESDDQSIYESIREVSARLASFNAVQASSSLSIQRQIALNRYYQRLHEFGINLSKKEPSQAGAQDLVQEFGADILVIKDQSKELFTLFKLSVTTVASESGPT